jgi:hypothetical protein
MKALLPLKGNKGRRIEKRCQPGRADTVRCEAFLNHSVRGIIYGFLTHPDCDSH